MAGIYVHIPFCKRRCRYCDFYSTSLENSARSDKRETYVEAVCREIELRREFLQGKAIKTLYFGGGTPSQLSPALLEHIVRKAEQVFGFESLDELTIEANPDDLSQEWIDGLKKAIPQYQLRISMGIQTFDDDILHLLGRRHTAQEAADAVHRLQDSGITEISIDLMYGLPMANRNDGKNGNDEKNETKETKEEMWQRDLDKAVSLAVPHISAYHLSYEEGTPLHQMRKRGEVCEVSEEESVALFKQLRRTLLDAGYRHYEISNFALPGHEARHNSSYWSGIPYLGLGPGAHSFDGRQRRWNHPNLNRYIEVLGSKEVIENLGTISSGETLSDDDRYNEYIMTRLRTAKGISPQEIATRFGEERARYCHSRAQTFLKSHRLSETADRRWVLTEEGIFVSDAIIADLFC